MVDELATVGIWCVLVGAWATLAGTWSERPRSAGEVARAVGPWRIALWCAVAIPSVVEQLVPGDLQIGWRDADAIADGEWWRLLTSMFLQDGGWPGTVFNLVILAVTLVLVARVLTGPVTVAVFLAGGLVGNLTTLAIGGATGAGNSMATIALACFAAALVLVRRRALVPFAVIMVAAVVLLCVLGDQHGFAAAAGVIGGAIGGLRPARSTPPPTASAPCPHR